MSPASRWPEEGPAVSLKTVMLALGVFYVAIGILGFVPGVTNDGLLIGIFAVNALHNIVHVALGAALIWGSRTANNMVNQVLAVVFAVLVVGSFIAPIVEQVPLNPPDTALHLVSALITGYYGFMRKPAMTPA
jgi:hypothetical protein